MGIFSPESINENSIDELLQDPGLLEESFIYDDINHMTESARVAFLASEECSILEAKGKISKKTIVRLNKNDDLTRRRKMAAYQLAKEHNDPLWEKLVLNRVKERDLIGKIVQKYGTKASRTAIIGQKNYIKGSGALVTKAAISSGRETPNNNKI